MVAVADAPGNTLRDAVNLAYDTDDEPPVRTRRSHEERTSPSASPVHCAGAQDQRDDDGPRRNTSVVRSSCMHRVRTRGASILPHVRKNMVRGSLLILPNVLASLLI